MAVTNSEFTFDSPRLQRFSFPYDMVEKMTKNPNSSKGYMKLLKTCKWFFPNGKILPVPYITLSKDVLLVFPAISVDVSTKFYKLWITDKLIISSITKNFIFLLKSKTYRCNDASIEIMTNVSLNVIKNLLSLSLFKDISIKGVKLRDDYSIYKVNGILNVLPANHSLKFFPEKGRNYYTMKIQPQSKNILVSWRFYGLSNDFDIQNVYNIAKKHKNNNDIDLYFNYYQNQKLFARYKQELNNFVENIIEECKTLDILLPMLSFPGSNKEAMEELEILRDNYKKKKIIDLVGRK